MVKTQVSNFLKSLPRSYFFKPMKNKSNLIGAIRGKLTYLLILENDRKMSISEIKFSEKIRRCGGDHFCIRSLNDICELAKIRGWHD